MRTICNFVFKSTWLAIPKALKRMAKGIIAELPNYTKKYVKIELPKLYRKHPEWLRDAILVYALPYDAESEKELIDASNNGFVYIYPENILEMMKKNKAIDDGLNALADKIPEMNEFDTVRHLHDLVCNKFHYCHEIIDGNYKHLTMSLYDLIYDDCCVCNGYARLFKALCDKKGIKCDCLINHNHMWNRVKLKGKWYYVDCTWDDGNTISSIYLMKTYREFYTYIGHPKHTAIYNNMWNMKGE